MLALHGKHFLLSFIPLVYDLILKDPHQENFNACANPDVSDGLLMLYI